MSSELQPKKRMGRPSSYKGEEYCALVIDLMSKGKSFAQCCAAMGISRQLFDDWRGRHEEFKEACLIGEMKALDYWENLAHAVATGAHKDHPQLSKANIKMIQFLISRRFRDYQRPNNLIQVNANGDMDQNKVYVYESQIMDGTIRRSVRSIDDNQNANIVTTIDIMIDEVTSETWQKEQETQPQSEIELESNSE